MDIYCAGKTHDYLKVRAVQNMAREHGHAITHDWTVAVAEHGPNHDRKPPTLQEERVAANMDREGVRGAELLVMLGNPNLCGTLVEFGIAAERNLPVWVIGHPGKYSIFYKLAGVWWMPNMDELLLRQMFNEINHRPVAEVSETHLAIMPDLIAMGTSSVA